MRRIDISMPLREAMAAFPGDPTFEAHRVKAIEAGDRYNLSQLSLGTHAGTHVDPPLHFVPAGAGIDRVDLAVLNGPCRVLRLPESATSVSPKHLAHVPRGTQRLLLRTRNSTRWATDFRFFPDYVAVEPAAATLLVERGVRLIGIDSLSVELDPGGTFPVHRELLGNGVIILEGLCLAGAPAGAYELTCLPLRILDGDGGPARAFLAPRHA